MNKNIKKLMKNKTEINLGARRTVYDLGNGFVLKVAKSKEGIASNKREVRMYRFSPPELKKHLARIQKYGDGYSWLIMKKYDLQFRQTAANIRKLTEMRRRFKQNGIIPREVLYHREPNLQNIRLKPNGDIIVIDYGSFIYRRSK